MNMAKAMFMRIYKNPFTKNGFSPKIPDGKAELSCGIRFQSIQEHLTDPEGILTFILYPGFGAGLRIFGSSVSYFKNATGALNTLSNQNGGGGAVIQSYTNHGLWNINDSLQNRTLNLQSPVDQWRIVSQGVRLSLTNNAQENDGWWEAVRISNPNDSDYYGYTPGPGGGSNALADFTNLRVCPSYNIVTHNQNGYNIVDHPTYMSGKLRDIHKMIFKLHPINADHDFTETQDSFTTDNGTLDGNTPNRNSLSGTTRTYVDAGTAVGSVQYDGAVSSTVDATTGNTTNVFAGGMRTNLDTAAGVAFKDMNVDNNFDLVLIRIHGRPSGTVAANSTPTRLLAHLVCNQEIIYPEGTIQARLMSPSPRAINNDGIAQAANGAGNPAIPIVSNDWINRFAELDLSDLADY